MSHFFFGHRFRNYFFVFLGIIFVFLFSRSSIFSEFILVLERYRYLSALFAGVLFSSTFTFAAGGMILLSLAKVLNPFGIISAAVIGAVFADLFVYFIISKRVSLKNLPLSYRHLLHTRYFAWTLPLIGAFIILSPLPNELAISLFSVSGTPPEEFAFVSLLSHTLVIFLLISAGSLFT